MGYATNVALAVPMALIMYMLTEKSIVSFTSESKFEERVQKSFVLGFVIGLAYIVLGLTLFSEFSDSHISNQSIKFALYASGVFLVLNSVFFNWDYLDEHTKIVILTISVVGLIMYSYS